MFFVLLKFAAVIKKYNVCYMCKSTSKRSLKLQYHLVNLT